MTNSEDFTVLTDEEEQRFQELFSPSDRLQLTHDWKRSLRDAITEERGEDATNYAVGDSGSGASVVSLEEHRAKRSWAGPTLAVAAAVMLVIFGLTTIDRPMAESEEIAVLGPELEIATPSFRTLELPENTVAVDASPRVILALSEEPASLETNVWSSVDGVEWTNIGTFPVFDATVLIDEDTWLITGFDAVTAEPAADQVDAVLGTNFAVLRSVDGGATWEQIDAPGIPQFDSPYVTTTASAFDVAQVDGIVLLHFTMEHRFDFTSTARELGRIGPDDVVVSVVERSGFWPRVFVAAGPDSFGPIELTAADLGLTQEELESVQTSNLNPVSVAARSVDGEAFEIVEAPTDTTPGAIRLLLGQTDQFQLWNIRSPQKIYVSTDALNWEKVDFDDERTTTRLNDEWRVRAGSSGDTLYQSVNGSSFSQVPRPDRSMAVWRPVPTDFGAAIVWLDFDSLVARSTTFASIERNGFTVESKTGLYTVTDPEGNVLVEAQSDEGLREGPVIITHDGRMLISDGQGSLAVELTDEDFFELENQFLFDEVETAQQLISWSTNGSDWKFASLGDLGGGLWNYLESPIGLLGVEMVEMEDAVSFDWPVEVVGE